MWALVCWHYTVAAEYAFESVDSFDHLCSARLFAASSDVTWQTVQTRGRKVDFHW